MKRIYLLKRAVIFLLVGLVACADNSGTTDTIAQTCTLGTGTSLNVSGSIKFERIPLRDNNGSLDFANKTELPARAIQVEAVCNSAIAVTTTDENGLYTLAVPSGTQGVFIRAKAQMKKTVTPSWDVEVKDASSNLLFALDSSPFNLDGLDVTKNLLAAAGDDGSVYPLNAVRSAAPFAILDTIYKSMQFVLTVQASAIFPALDVKWSADNEDGSYYTNNQINLVGSLNSDTDEFDEHVIAHEWGHYFQDAFSRDNSVGGFHAPGNILDIRVAFSEGFGNAFSAMVLGDPVYKDSQETTSGFTIDVESNNCTNMGWYSECSVQSVLYDFYDVTNEANDSFSLGFDEIHNIMTSNMPTSSALTSLFSFINPFKNLPAVASGDVDAFLALQSIGLITDDFATGVSSGAYITDTTDVLPLYDTRAFPLTNVCSTGDNISDDYVYGLGASRFIRFTAPSTGSFRFTSTWTSGLSNSDPDMYLYKNGLVVGSGSSTDNNGLEIFTANLSAGNEYVLEVLEYTYVNAYIPYNRSAAGAENITCFTVSRVQI